MVWQYIAAGVGTLLVLAAGKKIIENWQKVEKELKGKRIAVLGPRASGKTTIIKFLLKGELSEEYIATPKPEKYSGKTFRLQELELKIEDTMDVPGDIQSHDDWERLYRDADVACYLIDASKIHRGDSAYEKTVLSEMRHIGEWFDDRKDSPPHFFLIATHCDLISEYASLPHGGKTEFTDAFWKKPAVQNLINHGRGSKNVKCVAGSLKDRDGTERLVSDIFRQTTA
ncbi:hypothetical protein E6C67_02040 [Azospirillum sp. TSA2s]|uniref:GTPase domain-containing protein n=1 Tax=Azospirillum sp. TSA2s TaxID=709810 RepID=UPI0010AA7C04|nr:GTPase domain-containing protein [Azospirillum sp. TSA2s]QCG92718.1 hypothetical protein E6C67_02040 [Azospirillum sp. TSA2s]